jgi:hypothetical protein
METAVETAAGAGGGVGTAAGEGVASNGSGVGAGVFPEDACGAGCWRAPGVSTKRDGAGDGRLVGGDWAERIGAGGAAVGGVASGGQSRKAAAPIATAPIPAAGSTQRRPEDGAGPDGVAGAGGGAVGRGIAVETRVASSAGTVA